MPRNADAFEAVNKDDRIKPGAYTFMINQAGKKMGILHACPCGCGSRSAMWFRGMADAGGPEWDVAGEWPKVTLSPSIGIKDSNPAGGYHWHGFLENGVFVEK